MIDQEQVALFRNNVIVNNETKLFKNFVINLVLLYAIELFRDKTVECYKKMFKINQIYMNIILPAAIGKLILIIYIRIVSLKQFFYYIVILFYKSSEKFI